MEGNNPIKYSDLVKPDSSITDLIGQLDELNDAYMNALKNIKGEAISVKATLTGVSGATVEHRESIKGAATEADKLAKAQRELAFAESENAKQLAILKKAQAEANQLTKLNAKLNDSAVGSYNRLSAQYSINKIYLNNMSAAERLSTTEGQKLETETRLIYEEMKRLQEATGKTSLNVGNYKDATVNLVSVLKQNTAELIRMKMAGEEGTAAYNNLLRTTAELKDEIGDTKNEIKNMASDTSTLDSILGGAAAAGGGFSAFTGAMELFGAESDDVEKAQKKLQAAIAITTGLQAIQNAVQKDSALMLGVAKIQSYALSKAEAYRRLIQIQGTGATVGATIAQRAFNLVAAANPYVLLAMALITVVGALALFASGTESAAQQQAKANEIEKGYLELLELEASKVTEASDEKIQALERELDVAKARGASQKEIGAIENKIASERRAAHGFLMGYYANEIEQLDANKAKLLQYKEELIKLQQSKAGGTKKVMVDLELNGNVTKAKVDDAIEAIQGKIDNLGKQVEIGTKITDQTKELDAQAKQLQAQRIEQAKAMAKNELDLMRKAEDAKIKLFANSYEQQRAEINASYSRQIQDLQYQLTNEKNLTSKARIAINETIISLRQQLGQSLKDLDNKEQAERIERQRKSQDIEIASMEEGTTKKIAQTNAEYTRQIQDIQTRLNTERGLTKEQRESLTKDAINLQGQQAIEIAKIEDEAALSQLQKEKEKTELRLAAVKEGTQEEINLRIQLLQQQRQIELRENALKTSEVRQSEKDINAKYDQLILKETTNLSGQLAMLKFDQQQALDQSEFDLLRNSEETKTRFKLNAEKERLKKILELNKTAGVKMSDEEVKTIQNTIAKIDQEISKSKKDEGSKDIYGIFGLNLDDDAKEGISTSVSFAMDQLKSFADARVQAADAAVSAADKEVEARKNSLDEEIAARNAGYASNVTMAQKELDLAKKNQEKALKEQEKAQKAQAAIDTIVQTSSLITASAQIWKSLSGIPYVGWALALAAIGVMWGSFAASKIKASQMAKTKSYGDGTVELLAGGSHQSGNDIDLGTSPDGSKRRAEGGEFFAVINKRNSRRYRKHIPDVINSLNRGTFEAKYMNAYNTGGMAINVMNQTQDLKELQNDVRDIRKQNERRYFTNGRGETVEVYKNTKRTYKNN